MLTKYVLPSGAMAFVGTVLAGWGLSFIEYLSAIPEIFRWLFYLSLFLLLFALANRGITWRAKQEVQTTPTDAGTTGNIVHVETTVNVEQPTTSPTDLPPKSAPPRYRENEPIHIADLERDIREGKELVCDWVFKNCHIVGPAVLWVHAPQDPERPRTFVHCEWAENEDAFTIMSPDDYPDKSRLIGLHLCVFLGCRFTDVEMLVPQRTYERYRKGEVM
jgi:hypothetical protein